MALSPDDIVNHEFKQAIRGYAVKEVDDLLDRLADQLERAELDIAELRKRVAEADARASEALATESSLKRTLITAQDAAQRTLDDARTHAETVRADADREATERLDEAIARSTAMVDEAESEVHTIRASYRMEHEATAAQVAELAAIEERYRSQVRALLEHQLGEVERLEATRVPGEREVEQLREVEGLRALPRGPVHGSGDEDVAAGAGSDAGSDAVEGSPEVGDLGDEAEDTDDGDEQDLVPFGGLTVRVANDGAGPAERGAPGDRGYPHRGPLA